MVITSCKVWGAYYHQATDVTIGRDIAHFREASGTQKALILDLRMANAQTWWRGILARRLVELIRKDVTARRLQCVIRRYMQRSKFVMIRTAIIKLQSSSYIPNAITFV